MSNEACAKLKLCACEIKAKLDAYSGGKYSESNYASSQGSLAVIIEHSIMAISGVIDLAGASNYEEMIDNLEWVSGLLDCGLPDRNGFIEASKKLRLVKSQLMNSLMV